MQVVKATVIITTFCASFVTFVLKSLFKHKGTKIFTKGTKKILPRQSRLSRQLMNLSSISDSLVNLVNWYFHSRKSMQYSRVMSDGEKQKNLKLLLVGETD